MSELDNINKEVEDMKQLYLSEEQKRTYEEWDCDTIKLKDDDELKGDIADFGYGETKFHTADIWRLLKELMYWRTKYKSLRIKENETEKKQ